MSRSCTCCSGKKPLLPRPFFARASWTRRSAALAAAVALMFVALVLTCVLAPLLVQRAHAAAAACNGAAALCDRQYSNISLVGAHDSAFVGDLPTENQIWSVTDQLDNGVRFLQGQTHKDVLGTLSMCHTSCLELYAGSTVDYLSEIKTWLDANANQVVTVLLTNGDNVDPSLFDTALSDAGLKDYAFVPSSSPDTLAKDDWPTLQEMIDAGKRLVFFLDYGADEASYPAVLAEFNYFFETPFDTTDPDFPQCTLDRPAGASATGRMSLINHYLDLSIFGILIPDEAAAATTNAQASINAQNAICIGEYGANPNVILLDYTNEGDWIKVQNALNGV